MPGEQRRVQDQTLVCSRPVRMVVQSSGFQVDSCLNWTAVSQNQLALISRQCLRRLPGAQSLTCMVSRRLHIYSCRCRAFLFLNPGATLDGQPFIPTPRIAFYLLLLLFFSWNIDDVLYYVSFMKWSPPSLWSLWPFWLSCDLCTPGIYIAC